jgi:hypothetical protein
LSVVFPLAQAPDRFSRLQRRHSSHNAGELHFARLFQPCDGKPIPRKNNRFDISEDFFHHLILDILIKKH